MHHFLRNAPSHIAKWVLLTWLLGFCGGSLSWGFSIESVTVDPAIPLGQLDEVSLKVTLETPGSIAFLAQPTQVLVDRDEVLVILYPSHGMSGAIGVLTTNVPLGKLRVGAYRYAVVLVPVNSVADWGTKIAVGEFTVAPRLQILNDSPAEMLLLWPNSAENFVVQYADSLSANTVWNDLTYEREDNGEAFLARIERPDRPRFYRLVQRFP